MTLMHYTAEVKDGLLLELPTEAEALHLKPGDKVEVSLIPPPQALRGPTAKAASQVKPKQLRRRGMLAGILSTDEVMRRKQEDIDIEDRTRR